MFAMRFSIPGACLALLAILAAPDSQAATTTVVVSGITTHCALNDASGVLCWGYNVQGQLGNGTVINSSLPVGVSGLGSGVTQLASGNSHNCALVSGGVRCWGYNSYGQLGNGTSTNSNVPVAVAGLSGAVAVAAGFFHSCALMVTGGVKCWGYNGNGQLGDGTLVTRSAPVDVLGLSGAVGLAVGSYHSCALINNGQIQCWGNNAGGQLGNGSLVTSATRVNVTGIADADMIVAGVSHTCAKTTTGTARCWGSNSTGQLGSGGTTANVLTPVVVSGLSGVTQLAASSASNSTCAVLSGGSAKCWGSNASGQLGSGDTTNKTTPTTVTGLTGSASAITIGGDSACARVNNGVQCWGANNVGQHGAGNTAVTSFPQNVVGLFGSAPSQTPAPLSPVTSRFPVYTWNAIPGASSYRLRINGVTTAYTAAAANCPDGLGLCTVKSGLLTPGVYSWQVQGFDDYGDGVWSAILQFLI
jgi:alpha-tubulin suppressor-like RCC1 family protein